MGGVFRAARMRTLAVVLARARKIDNLLLLRGQRTNGAGPFGSQNTARNASSDSLRLDGGMSGAGGRSSNTIGRGGMLAISSWEPNGSGGIDVREGSDRRVTGGGGEVERIFAGTVVGDPTAGILVGLVAFRDCS